MDERKFINPDVENEAERQAILRRIDMLIRSKGWGSIDHNGKITPFEKEPQEMGGEAAKEFFEHAKSLGWLASHYKTVANKASEIIESHGIHKPLIADLGAGPGTLGKDMALKMPEAKIVEIDLSADMLKIAREQISEAGLNDRVEVLQMDAMAAGGYFQTRGKQPDLVVSRNMLHRVEDVGKFLLAFTKTAKQDGGIVYSVSFFNPQNFSTLGLGNFYGGIRRRSQYPHLQKAWTLAYLNAPTLEQYKAAGKYVQNSTPIKNISIEPDNLNYVNILIEK